MPGIGIGATGGDGTGGFGRTTPRKLVFAGAAVLLVVAVSALVTDGLHVTDLWIPMGFGGAFVVAGAVLAVRRRRAVPH